MPFTPLIIIEKQFGKYIAFVKVDELFEWKQVFIWKATGNISIWPTKDEARTAARKFAQQEINKSAR